ncbi:ThuA domain-containing protein [Aggregatimonas sangjinii]|uniref:ThuA domain-containing protein n=1 Tax=Aggregatimonas sangjinii TaxID=2583587 RepID=A0A5B7SY28_9FLAO|nr:ThuA domain-containing protein [Aggregatimonas sangjinii]QCX01781.1 ThuA domain-containing protein [Aggregatimonas sangjinii]
MKKVTLLLLIGLMTFAALPSCSQTENTTIQVLILDGQNNHVQWPKITFMLKEYLEETGLFSVEVARSAYTWKGEQFLDEFPIEGMEQTEALEKPKTDPSYSPDFSKYDVVISNFGWNAADWPEKTQNAFEAYIENGGGLVVFHAADNSFPNWEAYNKMIGLGGWGDRTEKDGPYVYYNDSGEEIRDETPGKAGAHGPQSEYQIRIRNSEHPITKGMPEIWMHTKDELYNSLRGPAENMEILATAYADPNNKGTGRHEPALMVLNYGKGRIFHNIMGHIDYSVNCVGFITTMLRGTEWAATGMVTQEIPEDFPSAEQSRSREILKE